MVGEPEHIEVLALEWDEVNTGHLIREHGVHPADVEYVRSNNPLFFCNLPGRGATHVMIGIDDHGYSLYVPIIATAVPGRWRAISAWRSGLAHRLYYKD